MRRQKFIFFFISLCVTPPLIAETELVDLPESAISIKRILDSNKRNMENQVYSSKELLEISGHVKQLKTLPSDIRARVPLLLRYGIEAQGTNIIISETRFDNVIELMIEAFHPDRIISELEDRIEGMFSVPEQLELQKFFDSDLGQRLQAIPMVLNEEAALAEGTELFQSDSHKRRELIKALVQEEKRWVHTEIATLLTAVDTAVYFLINEHGMTNQGSARAYLNDMQLFHYKQQFGGSASPILPQRAINAMAYSTRNFSDDDLIKSLAFIENPVGRKYDYEIENLRQEILKSCLLDFKKKLWEEMGFSPFRLPRR